MLLTANAARGVVDNVINSSGIIVATSASSQNGEIVLSGDADTTVNVSGTLNASGAGAGETGGSVTVAGGTINVASGANIDASGNAGGGTVNIGGSMHGNGPLPNAQTTTLSEGATITADATDNGNGGTVVVWSSNGTIFNGSISAQGGAHSGRGGYVETSGGVFTVGSTGTVNTLAPKGGTGTWLLDPNTIDIQTTASDGSVTGCNSEPVTCTIAPSTITTALGSTDVTLEANNEINVYNDVLYSSTNVLSLLSSGDINGYANIQNSGSGAINLIAGWDQTVVTPAQVASAGGSGIAALFESNPTAYGNPNVGGNGLLGDVTIGGANAVGNASVGSASGTTTVLTDDLTIEADNGYAQLGYHGPAGGDIYVYANNDITLTTTNSSTADFTALIGNGSLNGDVTGNITGSIYLWAQGNLVLNSYVNTCPSACVGGSPWIGNYASSGSIKSGNVTLIAMDSKDNCTDTCNNGDNFTAMIENALGTTGSSGSGGDVTVGFINPINNETQGLKIDKTIAYDSPNNLDPLGNQY